MSPMFNYWDSPGEFFRQMMIGFDFLIDWAPLWAPFVFGYLFWQNWVRYVRRQFLNGEEHELIEVRLPEDIKKTPQAMEVVLNALHQTGGETTFIDRYWKGSVRPHFSLELVSLEGDIHFFIWTRSFHRQIVENAIYAQYPDVEVRRVPDYTHYVEFSEDKLSLWGCEFKLTKPDAYPIRTYIDYGMQPGQKDEESVDPITPIIEYLGSLQKNEQAWIQIIVRAHKKKRKSGTFLSWTDVRDEGQKLIDEIMGREGSSKKLRPSR